MYLGKKTAAVIVSIVLLLSIAIPGTGAAADAVIVNGVQTVVKNPVGPYVGTGASEADSQSGWHVTGPGGGGTFAHPSVSPHDSNLVYIHTDMSGNLFSWDGGYTWKMYNFNGVARACAFDPVDPNVIYTGGIGLYKSVDRGETFYLVYPDPDKNTRLYYPDDSGESYFTTDDNWIPPDHEVSITAIAIDQNNTDRVYISIWDDVDEVEYFAYSDTGGTSFTYTGIMFEDLAPAGPNVKKLYVDPKDGAVYDGMGNAEIAEVKRVLNGEGLEISALCGDFGCRMFYFPEEMRAEIEREKRVLELAKKLGTDIVTTHIGVVPEDFNSREFETMNKVCKELADFADSLGGHFAVETGPEPSERLKRFWIPCKAGA